MATIYFATNRNPNTKTNPDGFGGDFNSVSVDSLRFGRATVTGGKVTKITVAPEKLQKDHSKARLGSSEIFQSLQAGMAKGVDTLVFIHGYNVSFNDALRSAGALADKYKPINVVLFSWPSDGSMMPFLAYKRDRTDAVVSGPALARALLKLREFLETVQRGGECKAAIHLMAHSMGNYVLRHGLQELRRHAGGQVPRLFDQIVLVAADEDHDAFEHEHKLSSLPELGRSVSTYFNTGDTALVISDKTKSNPTRLGSRGPRLPLNVPGNVTIIDVSEVVTGTVEHHYYHKHTATVRDIKAVLKGTSVDVIPGRKYVASQNRYVLRKK